MTPTKPLRNVDGNPNDVWVIQHGEVYAVHVDGRIGYPHDHVVMGVATSLKEAIAFIKPYMVDPYSWWVIRNYPLNKEEYDNPKVVYYNHKKRKVKMPPVVAAIRAYKKAAKTNRFFVIWKPSP